MSETSEDKALQSRKFYSRRIAGGGTNLPISVVNSAPL